MGKRTLPGKPLPARLNPADIVRLLVKVVVGSGPPNGFRTPCWHWQGGTDEQGYGFIKVHGHKRWVHRVSHEVFIGPVPAGSEVDHKCHVRDCINPEHIAATLPAANRARTRRAPRPIPSANDGVAPF